MKCSKPRLAFVRALAFVVFSLFSASLLGCSSFSGPADGLVPCAQTSECPPNYYCAGDRTCWSNGAGPTVDASALPDGSVACVGKAVCAGACTDTASDPANCGGCGTACTSGLVCSKGTCALSCGGGTTQCGQLCSDTTSDPLNCGSCGNACPAGLVCSDGACALTCTGGATKCGNACVDTTVDGANCGACGVVCGAGQLCSAGKCASACGAGLTTCGGGDGSDAGAPYCANTGTDNANCGSCGHACGNGLACTGGTCATTCPPADALCTGADAGPNEAGSDGGGAPYCANLHVDPANCGACGVACSAGSVCSGGACQLSCQTGLVECGGICVDPTTSLQYCGATAGCGDADAGGSAGTACAGGSVCANGVCQVSCPANEVNCGGTCVDPLSSPSNCGATGACGVGGSGSAGTACSNGNVCANGTCQVSCPGTQINCGGVCIAPLSSRLYCGATPGCGVGDAGSAGTACASGTVCSNGSCQVSCPGNQIDCGGVCIDPQTSLSNCGASGLCGSGGGSAGTRCAIGNVCGNGTCQVACPGNEIDCGGVCIDPRTSLGNCGASGACGLGDAGSAGTVCSNGNVCANGTCQVSCPGTQIDCGGNCVDPLSSTTNCGASGACGLGDAGSAGTACSNGNVCANGTCQVSCPGNQIDCGGACVDPQTSLSNCGASGACGNGGGSAGVACAVGSVCGNGSCQVSCPGNEINCGGTCVDPRSSNSYCGASGACGAGGAGSAGTACSSGNVCANGTCQVSCPGTEIDCGGICIDPLSSLTHCGASGACGLGDADSPGTACTSGNVCANGTCQVSCPGNQINCGGACIDPATSLSNCGASGACGNGGGSTGVACAVGSVCGNGTCQVSCPGNEINCGGVCVDPRSNNSYCGASGACGAGGSGSAGAACSNGNVCANGTCQVSCPGTEIDCGGSCIDPLSSLTNCGASGACGVGGSGSQGTACSNGNVCANGSCQVSCPGNEISCGGVCIDPQTSLSNCGASGQCGIGGGSAGAACAVGSVCGNGTCQVSCPGNEINCGGVCVDPLTSNSYCGASGACGVGGSGSAGAACSNGNVCANGTCQVSCPGTEIDCGGSCVDPLSSLTHCGASGACGLGGAGSAGTACSNGNVCSNGTCQVSCPGSQIDCGGTCIDPTTSLGYCGASGQCGNGGGSAGVSCTVGSRCVGGTCQVSCPANEVDCGGTCIDPLSSNSNCGASGACGLGGVGSAGIACSNGNVCANGLCQVSCPGSQINCNGTCVDPLSSRSNCGATAGCGLGDAGSAGTTCSSGTVCSNGSCQVSCPGNEINCGGVCIDPQTSLGNCGAIGACGSGGGSAGTACAAGNVCGNGVCAVACPGTQINCGGTCIDPLTSRSYCGATGLCGNGGGSAGSSCTNGNVCSNGSCQVSCPGNEINCGGTCVDPLTNRSFCGATGLCGSGGGSAGAVCSSGNVCGNGTCQVSCPGNEINCGGTCVDPLTSRSNCGATGLCGNGGGSAGATCTNGNVCSAGSCQVSCPGSEVNCGGVCVDPLTSPTNCGASGLCGNGGGSSGSACTNGKVCSAGACKVSCPGSQINCGGTCIDPLTSLSNCGASGLCGTGGGSAGTPCAAGNVCGNGVCSVACPGTQINCGGTCVDPLTSRSYCGASGLCGSGGGSAGSACTNGNVCNNGSCQVSCPGSQINCGGTCIDPLTSRSNCGASGLCGNGGGAAGALCGAGTVCAAGSCQVSCPGTEINCGGTCVDPLTNRAYCGASGLCGSGGGSAGTACVSGNVCSGGTCQVSCPGTEINCGGTCIAPLTSSTYCGATGLCGNGGGSAGAVCGNGTACASGTCSASCASPLIACGSCVDPRYDPAHCGSCSPCPAVPNATNFCANAVCGIAACSGTFANCDGVVSNGCEADRNADPNNCGACGKTCSGATPACLNGTCAAQPVVCNTAPEGGTVTLSCPGALTIRAINYASYGTPNGSCGSFTTGSCNATNTTTIVTAACFGQGSCTVGANNGVFGDPCGGTVKRLYIQVTCGSAPSNPVTAGLIANYDARVGSSIALSGNAVLQWNDTTANGNNLSINGTAPAYNPALINGYPGIDFSGAAGMISAPFGLTTSVTVFFVTQWRSPGAWGSLGHHGNRDSDWAMEQNGLSGNANAVHWQTNNDNGGDQLTLAAGSNWILAGRMDPTSGRYFSATSTAGGLLTTTAAPPNSITAGSKALYVGKSDANEASNAYIGQIVYYNRSLSDSERDQVIAYLRSGWGI